MTHELYFGDNLDVLRASLADDTVDLVYLDPPFNSKRDYNLLFKSPTGHQSDAQITAFEDTWRWGPQAEREFDELLHQPNTHVAEVMRAFRGFLGENDVMAYLTMMANRLIELHRVLKTTGSIYLHCDPVASHYLKIVLDGVFGKENFRSEIVWRRAGSHNPRKKFGPIHDTILYYAKSKEFVFNVVRRPYMRRHVKTRYTKQADGTLKFTSGGNVLTGAGSTDGPSGQTWRGFDPSAKNRHWAVPGYYETLMPEAYAKLNTLEKLEALFQEGHIEIDGKSAWPIMVRYLGERDGVPISDIWAYQPYTQGTLWGTDQGIDGDVEWLGPTDPDRLGYPTQKPIGLLERIILASSNENDVILDPFCGCGTAVHAAENLKRRWIGIDITHLAISLIEKRLRDAFPGIQSKYEVHGVPKDFEGAQDLAKRDKYQFQWWACSQVNAQPYQGKKKGADKGIDGLIFFRDDDKAAKKIVVSIKGGANVGVGMIRDLIGVMKREKAEIGLFVTLAEPPARWSRKLQQRGSMSH